MNDEEQMDNFDSYDDPRCPQCNVPLVRAGAICVGCDEGRHYSSPDRTSPLMRFEQVSETFGGQPLELDEGQEDQSVAHHQDQSVARLVV